MKKTPLYAAWTGCRTTVLVAAVLTLTTSGCKSPQPKEKPADKPAVTERPPARMDGEFSQKAEPKTSPPTAPFPDPAHSSLRPKDAQAQAAGVPGGDKAYSFSAKGLDIKDALALFARTFELNILPDPDVTGTVTLDFKNLALEKAMDALLEVFGYYAEYDRGLIRVKGSASEMFTLDYLRMVRSGNGNSSANIASGSSGGSSSGGSSSGGSSGGGSSSGGSSGGDGVGISISQSDTVKFWEELDDQMKGLITEKGKFVINRTAGQIFVTDQRPSLDRIRQYLSGVRQTMHRQVDIEARIYEVVLNDEYHLGVDWQNVMGKVGNYYMASGGSVSAIASSRNIVDSPMGGNAPGAPALSLAMGNKEARAVVDALKEMGTLRVVSQPRIRTLNNQSAMIKVGLDKPFFSQTVETTTSTGPALIQTATEVRIVTVGTILSITPQISEDGFISMDVSPIITRLVQTAKSKDGNTTAPEMDTKQTSSLVRLKSGTTVVIGGLIQDERYSTIRKVPFLGDIPLIGKLMTGTYKNQRKTELVIFITPTVVD